MNVKKTSLATLVVTLSTVALSLACAGTRAEARAWKWISAREEVIRSGDEDPLELQAFRYQNFLENYPSSRHAPVARERLKELEHLQFDRTRQVDDIKSYQAYLSRFRADSPGTDSEHRRFATARLEELRFEEAYQDNTTGSYQAFLNDYPESSRADDVRSRIATLDRDQEEMRKANFERRLGEVKTLRAKGDSSARAELRARVAPFELEQVLQLCEAEPLLGYLRSARKGDVEVSILTAVTDEDVRMVLVFWDNRRMASLRCRESIVFYDLPGERSYPAPDKL